MSEELKTWKGEIDKRVVHLTSRRMEVDEILKHWQLGYIHSELQKALLKFYQWVPDSRICDALREEKERVLSESESKGDNGMPTDATTFQTGTAID